MPYSEIKVVAGGLAHIPIIIGFFYFIQNKIFAKKTDTPVKPEKKPNFSSAPDQKSSPSSSSNSSALKELAKEKQTAIPEKSIEDSKGPETSINDSGSPSTNKLKN